jgi:hypothetical protein
MISRTVSKHTPEAQLNRQMFKNFIVTRKSIKNILRDKKTLCVNIDNIPKMYVD